MTREEIMQLNTDYLNGCESEHKMNELFGYVLELQKHEQQPCEDCISRADAIDAMSNAIKRVFPEHRDIAEKTMNKLQPVTPQPKTGRWVYDERIDKHYYCSECKSMGVYYWDYCPYCGAKMQEVEE